MRSAGIAVAAIALGVLATACTGEDAAHRPIRVTGRLFDSETGKPVSRRTIWVHGFNDELTRDQPGQFASLEPEDETSFAMRLATPNVRLRIADKKDVYKLFENTFTATDGKLDVDVRLEPTHWIRLHGRMLYRDGEKLTPVDHGDGSMGCCPLVDIGPASWVYYDDDGAYSVLVPRELLKIRVVDTDRHPRPAEIDLRGATEGDRQFDVILEVRNPAPAGK